MAKKRLIFTLLYKNGNYMLSRNFRLQKVGNLEWLNKHYNFQNIAFSIDELIVLNVEDPEKRDLVEFSKDLRSLSKFCFIPIAVGGGINSMDDANLLLHSGADKLVLNTAFYSNKKLIKELIQHYGKQNIVSSIDFKRLDGENIVLVNNGLTRIEFSLKEHIDSVCELGAGEIYLNSIDKDGTGQGYELDIFDEVTLNLNTSLICAGGAGKYEHFLEGINKSYIDGVATANLFNFLGNGLQKSREFLIDNKVNMAKWHNRLEHELKNILRINNE